MSYTHILVRVLVSCETAVDMKNRSVDHLCHITQQEHRTI